VTLVVYSAQGYDKVMTAAFQKATGIPVKLDDNSAGPLLTQIEASKNNPNWELLWVDGTTAFAGLDQRAQARARRLPRLRSAGRRRRGPGPARAGTGRRRRVCRSSGRARCAGCGNGEPKPTVIGAAGQALGSDRDDDVAHQPGISP
jgi:hypothetical protein